MGDYGLGYIGIDRTVNGPGATRRWLCVCVYVCVCGGVGQLGMAHPSDGPASSLRMFGHVHRAMCGGGCQFEVLEEHACT